MTADESLWVARAKAGDQAAFADVHARHERRIYRFVHWILGNPEGGGST
jgi:hypothetical protein